jgi:hypothetical protein
MTGDSALPQEISEEIGGGETIKDAILALREDLGYGPMKISAWFEERNVSITKGAIHWVLKSEGFYGGIEEGEARLKGAASERVCEACGNRPKRSDLRFLCAACYRGGDSEVLSEHSLSASSSAGNTGVGGDISEYRLSSAGGATRLARKG